MLHNTLLLHSRWCVFGSNSDPGNRYVSKRHSKNIKYENLLYIFILNYRKITIWPWKYCKDSVGLSISDGTNRQKKCF